jgi:hypothetical protein
LATWLARSAEPEKASAKVFRQVGFSALKARRGVLMEAEKWIKLTEHRFLFCLRRKGESDEAL